MKNMELKEIMNQSVFAVDEHLELLSYLNENNLPYIQGCLLVGLSLYAKKDEK